MSVYLDHNATSPLHPEVLGTMMPYLQGTVGNASSLHSAGRMARSAIETARASVADLVKSHPSTVVFTSGGSEANNLLLKGLIDYQDPRPIISSAIEHPSILQPLKQLQQCGQKVIYLPVDENGVVQLDAASEILTANPPKLLTVMLANNETGVIQPVKQLAEMVEGKDCLVHTDATQMFGKLPVDMRELGVDALTISAHKFQGPQGVGALVTSEKPRSPLISGGAQERFRRAGTENVAALAGFGKAAELAGLEIDNTNHHLEELRVALESRLQALPGVVIFGRGVARLPNTSFFSLPYYHGETLLMELDKAGFALASGSACHSAVTEPSHVLSAMNVASDLALNAVRVSLGRENTLEQVEALVDQLEILVNSLPAIVRQIAV